MRAGGKGLFHSRLGIWAIAAAGVFATVNMSAGAQEEAVTTQMLMLPEPISLSALDEKHDVKVGDRIIYTDPFDKEIEYLVVVAVPKFSQGLRSSLVLFQGHDGLPRLYIAAAGEPFRLFRARPSQILDLLVDGEVHELPLVRGTPEAKINVSLSYCADVSQELLQELANAKQAAVRIDSSEWESDAIVLTPENRSAIAVFLEWQKSNWENDLQIPRVEHLDVVHSPEEQVVEFAGVQLTGRRVLYLVDLSGSMDREDRFKKAKQLLQESISLLSPEQKFAIVAFSDTAWPLGGRQEWTDASSAGKRWARSSMLWMTPLGATNLQSAVLCSNEHFGDANAVVLLTDGEFNESEVSSVVDGMGHMLYINDGAFATFTIGSTEGESAMRELAESFGGTYAHIEP